MSISDSTSSRFGSAELLARVQAGSPSAEEELFFKYVDRLTRLARSRLSAKLARRVGADDIVQSAWKSFFLLARESHLTLQRSGDLWRLLVTLTMRKLSRQATRHSTAARSYQREAELTSVSEFGLTSAEPTPADAAAMTDELEQIMQELQPFQRRILELRLQGYQQAEIATEAGCAERTVRRQLKLMRGVLRSRLDQEHRED